MIERVNHHSSKLKKSFLSEVIGELIKRRRALGLTQDELNYQLGVADRLVSKWECGLRTPSFNLHCWAYALGAKLAVIANDNRSAKKDALPGKDNDNGSGKS